jgi:hypothetical protein
MMGAAQAATFNVPAGNETALIKAISQANANGAADIINLAPNATYTLAQPVNAAIGLPSVTSEIIVNGNSSVIRRSHTSGTPAFHIFPVSSTGIRTLNNLTIRNGRARTDAGGGILNLGTLNATDSVLSGNSANLGGGVDNAAAGMNLTDSTLSGNSASTCGGINNEEGGADVTNSTVSGNSGNVGGGICNVEFGNVFITNSLVVDNTSGGNCSSESGFNVNGNNLDTDGSYVSSQTVGG